jgi:hypothetical protein
MAKQAAGLHKKAAEHNEHAAHHHKEAAKHYEAGAHEKAAHHAHLAHGHGQQAIDAEIEAAKSMSNIMGISSGAERSLYGP